jgi:hypothetical protein
MNSLKMASSVATLATQLYLRGTVCPSQQAMCLNEGFNSLCSLYGLSLCILRTVLANP